jgi:hypothetical protein
MLMLCVPPVGALDVRGAACFEAASRCAVWAGLRVVPFLNLLRLLDRCCNRPQARTGPEKSRP